VDLFTLKGKLAEVTEAHVKANTEYMEALSSAASDPETHAELKVKRDDLLNRATEMQAEVGRLEAEAAIRLADQEAAAPKNDKDRYITAKAAFYRAVARGQEPSRDVLNTLQAIPAGGASGGENFLPTQLANDLISEPFTTNPLRDIIRLSNVVGLELPRISYTLDDDDFVGDDSTAKELAASGDKVSFGRFKSKVFCDISDSILNGSDVGLVNHVENALRSGLAAKEKKVSFSTTAAADEEHMSFYEDDSSGNVIEEVTGESFYDAITAALDDLHEDFRENAKILMRRVDYTSIVKELANGNATLFTAPPEAVLGYPVVFCDLATTPVVGDFNYCGLNYEGTPTYESDKNIKTGDTTFALTAWFDQQRLLNSAFRLAVVEASA